MLKLKDILEKMDLIEREQYKEMLSQINIPDFYKCIAQFSGLHISEVNDEIVGNSFYKEKIIFFDKSLEIKNQISDIKCGSLPSSIISVNKDLLFIGGEAIYIIQISEKKVINYIAFDSNCYKKCLFFDYENNEIIIGDERGRLSLYYLDNNQYEEIKDKKFSCVDNIYSIVKSNNGIIAICSKDIILWGLN